MTQSTSPIYNGRYELRNQIARGGTAQVYLAHDILLDRPVALKVLYPELSTNTSFVERFRREAQAAANLSHPNIVPIFDWGESDNTYFIVMEYVDGEPLSSIIRTQAPLDAAQAAAVASDIAKALGFAHRHGVVHRDVKPGNVLITQDGQVKVTDFGIARAIGADEQVTQTGLVMGTATYFSPEQAQGFGVDGRSDIYSLGVVLYEMVTGRAPFAGDTPVAIAYQHVREHPPAPRDLNPTIPAALEAIILQAMAKLPAERYTSADEMRADLERFTRGQTVLARPPHEAFTGPTTEVVSAKEINSHLGGAADAEEPVSSLPPSNTRRWLLVGVALLIAIVAVIIIGGKQLGYFGGGRFFTVPNVKGMTTNAALAAIKSKGLTPTTVPVPGTITNQNKVIAQDPPYPNTVRTGAKVILTVAGAAPTAKVPSVVNMLSSAAASAVRKRGFVPRSVPEASLSTSAKENQVVKESPSAGTTKPKGSIVTIYYVQNKQTQIPILANDNEAQAAVALTKANLNVGQITNDFSPSVPQGNVISTSPASGKRVRQGTPVALVISEGAGVTVPSLLGDSASQAANELSSIGLRGQQGRQVDTTVAGYIGNVAQQRVAGSSAQIGDVVAPNSTVIYRLGVSPNTGNTGTSTTTTTTTTPTTTTATTVPPPPNGPG